MAGKHGIVSTCFNHINHKYHNHPQKKKKTTLHQPGCQPPGRWAARGVASPRATRGPP